MFSLERGSILNKYQINEFLFDYEEISLVRATNLLNNESYLLKTISPSIPKSHLDIENYIQILQHESKILCKLNESDDKYFLRYIETIYEDDFPILVYEDFPNCTLLSYLTPITGFNVEIFLNIAINLLKGLEIIHKNNFLFLSLTPSHILIDIQHSEIKYYSFLHTDTSFLFEQNDDLSLKFNNKMCDLPCYFSPEQTGRTDRRIDYRTDFYSLGMTMYNLLTGSLPFTDKKNFNNVIYDHLTKLFSPLTSIILDLPLSISNIVSKLLSKNPDDRYQSADGILYDLEIIQKQMQNSDYKNTDPSEFSIGSHDLPSRFRISQKLYGNDTAISIVKTVLQNFISGNDIVLLIKGPEGIGKTRMLQHIKEDPLIQHAYLLGVTFDPHHRDVISGVRLQLLFEQAVKFNISLEDLKHQMSTLLSDDLDILLSVSKSFCKFLGRELKVLDISETERKSRLISSMNKLLQIFATSEHPILFYLDEMQWMDDTMFPILSGFSENIKNTLFICTVRDNDCSDKTPIHKFFEKISERYPTKTINMTPLSFTDTTHYIADSMNCDMNSAINFSRVLYQVSQGSPLYTSILLREAYNKGIIVEHEPYKWYLRSLHIFLEKTPDVVSALQNTVAKLTIEQKYLLKVIIIFSYSHYCTLENLKLILSPYSEEEISSLITVLVENGLVVQTEKYFHITHHKILDILSSYFEDPFHRILFSENSAFFNDLQIHLNIGRVLQRIKCPEIIELATHLNAALPLIDSDSEKFELAQINHDTAHQFKLTCNYTLNLDFLLSAKQCLVGPHWETHPELSFQVYKDLIEGYVLLNRYDEAKKLINQTIRYCTTDQTIELQTNAIIIYTMECEFSNAIEIGKTCLASASIHISNDDLKLLPEKIAKVSGLLCSKLSLSSLDDIVSIDQFMPLLELPIMRSKKARLINFLLSSISTPCYLAHSPLYPLVSIESLELILAHGLMPNASKVLTNFFCIILRHPHNFKRTYAAARLGVLIAERLNAKSALCQACFFLNLHSLLWVRPFRESNEILQRGYTAGKSSGEVQFTTYTYTYLHIANPVFRGDSFLSILKTCQEVLDFQTKAKNTMGIFSVISTSLCINNFIDRTSAIDTFETEGMTEEQFLKKSTKTISLSTIVFTAYYILKAMALFIHKWYDSALKNIQLAKTNYIYHLNTLQDIDLNFYSSLILIACYNTAQPHLKAEYLNTIKENLNQMEIWSNSCPDNFRHKYCLIKAELAQLENSSNYIEIMAWYEEAIELSKKNKFIQDAAIILELTAMFLDSKNLYKTSRFYLIEAYDYYMQRGSLRKCRLLKQEFPNIFHQSLSPTFNMSLSPSSPMRQFYRVTSNNSNNNTYLSDQTPFRTESSTSSTFLSFRSDGLYTENQVMSSFLDVGSILDAAQLFETEPELKCILPKMIKIIVRNAGAQKAVLFLARNFEEFLLQASYTPEEIKILQGTPLEPMNDIYPCSVIKAVKSTRKAIIMSHSQRNDWQHDKYFDSHALESFLCTPIIFQSNLIGILYLENTITASVFSRDRLSILQLLSSLLAFSLENAERQRKQDEFHHSLENQIQQTSTVLKENKYRFHQILSVAPVGIFESDPDGIPLEANPYFLQLVGIDVPDMSSDAYFQLFKNKGTQIVDSWYKSVHPDDFEKVTKLWFVALKNLKGISTEYRFLSPEKKDIKWVFCEIKPVLDSSNRLKSWIAIIVNISTQKLLIEKEQEKERQLLSRFVRNICHEIRNPLFGITGNIGLLKEDLNNLTHLIQDPANFTRKISNEFYENVMKKINDMSISGAHQLNILDKVLYFQRFNAGEEKVFLLPMRIQDIVYESISTLSSMATQKGLTIKSHFYPNQPIYIKSDSDQLKRVLINFIANGIKYSEKGSVSIIVRIIQTTPKHISFIIEINDTGKGMTEDQIQNLGKLFWRGDLSEKGTGIGIAISKNILDLLGGKMLPVKSSIGHGTSFSFELTCETLNEEEIKILNQGKSSNQSTPSCNTPSEEESPQISYKSTSSISANSDNNSSSIMKILIVDDNEMIRNILFHILTKIFKNTILKEKYSLVLNTAESGREAITKFLTTDIKYGIIFMDIWMKGMDGMEATKIIRLLEKESFTPKSLIFGLSGHALDEDKLRASSCGMDKYLTKPTTYNTLEALILQSFS